MSARWWAFLIWAGVAASAAYWGLRLFAAGPGMPPQATVAPAAASPRGDLARLFGADAAPAADAPPPPASSRFQLVGVVASRRDPASRDGVALIAVDGKPARAYRVGAAVDGDTVLQAVRARGVSLGPRGGVALVSLDIPPPAPAATGTLPPPGAPSASPAPTGLPNLAPPTPPGLPGATLPRPPTVAPMPGRVAMPPRQQVSATPTEPPPRVELTPTQ